MIAVPIPLRYHLRRGKQQEADTVHASEGTLSTWRSLGSNAALRMGYLFWARLYFSDALCN